MKQGIANSWPNSMDDSCARAEWGWKPNWNLESMTKDMLKAIREKQAKGLI
jgi:nucleoside-diphosphate-sugar epimerase